MLIGVGPALLALSTGIYHLFSAGWIRPPPLLSRLGASLIGWAGESDEWLKQSHILDRKALRARGAEVFDRLSASLRAVSTAKSLVGPTHPITPSEVAVQVATRTSKSSPTWIPPRVDPSLFCPIVDWERMSSKRGLDSRGEVATALSPPPSYIIDTSRFCPSVGLDRFTICLKIDSPKVAPPTTLPRPRLDPTKFCIVVAPELEFMCALQPIHLLPPVHLPPIRNSSALPPFVGSVCLFFLLLFTGGFVCYACGWHRALAQILHLVRFLVPQAPALDVAVTERGPHTMHHGVQPADSLSEILLGNIIAPVETHGATDVVVPQVQVQDVVSDVIAQNQVTEDWLEVYRPSQSFPFLAETLGLERPESSILAENGNSQSGITRYSQLLQSADTISQSPKSTVSDRDANQASSSLPFEPLAGSSIQEAAAQVYERHDTPPSPVTSLQATADSEEMLPSSRVLTVVASQPFVPLNVEPPDDAVGELNYEDHQSTSSHGIAETWSYERQGERTYDTIDMVFPRSGKSGSMALPAQTLPAGADAGHPVECGPASPQQSSEGSSLAPSSMDTAPLSTDLQGVADSEHARSPSPEAEVDDEVPPIMQVALLDSDARRQSMSGSPPLLEPEVQAGASQNNEVQIDKVGEEMVDQEEGHHMDRRTPQLVQGSPPRRTRQASSVAPSRASAGVHQGTRAARPMGPNVHKRVLEFQQPQPASGIRSSATPANGRHTHSKIPRYTKDQIRRFNSTAAGEQRC